MPSLRGKLAWACKSFQKLLFLCGVGAMLLVVLDPGQFFAESGLVVPALVLALGPFFERLV